MNGTNERLEELLFSSSSQPFSEAERAELNALLRDNAEARIFAARFLTIDALLTESLAASEHTTAFQPIPLSAGRSLNRPNWLAHAAAWIGGFHLFGNTAKAATATSSATTGTTLLTQSTIIILMKKTVTSITAAILVLGSSGIYAIHHTNESSRNRLVVMETEIQSLSDQLGIKSTRSTQRKAGTGNSRKQVSVSQVSAILSDSMISRHESAQYEAFKKQLVEMDAESLKNMLLDAEKISSPIHGRVAEMILYALIAKDPAVATQTASELIGRGSQFQFLVSAVAAKAFEAWLAKDPAAADAWYVATVAAGGLISKNIPDNGLENFAIDRSFARLRFAEQIKTNPAEAAAMMASMLPGDVTSVIQGITDPATLLKFLPKLDPAQRGPAAEGAIKAMATTDIKAAFSWTQSLEMSDQDRSSLLATGIEAAVENGKLDLAGVSEWSKGLNLDAKRRSEMLVSAAKDVSFIPGVMNHRKLPSVAWDRAPERIDWLRKEAPAETAEKAVGDYLGRLFWTSRELDPALQAYEQEVARQGRTDPDLTMAFASSISIIEDDGAKAVALKLLNKLPPSEKRDRMIQNIELNR